MDLTAKESVSGASSHSSLSTLSTSVENTPDVVKSEEEHENHEDRFHRSLSVPGFLEAEVMIENESKSNGFEQGEEVMANADWVAGDCASVEFMIPEQVSL